MKLILLVGPSGSGKDTLLRAARRQFDGSRELGFVRRYITRPADGNEDNYYVDNFCFNLLRDNGFFASAWQAHGNKYGIPRHALNNGSGYRRLLCSISRGAIGDFDKFDYDVTVLLVTAGRDVLRERLQSRGRESGGDIEKRLLRALRPVEAKKLVTFDNSGSLSRSKRDFIALLEKV